MKTNHRIISGDSRDMSYLHDGSVDLIITSPPYWQLKDYGGENQIGFNDTYEAYINHLNLVWTECYRVLHDGCRLCVNIGDQFARSVYYGRYKVIPIHSEVIRFCETIGFDFLGQIIWQKTTTTNTTGGASIMGSFPYPRNGIVKLDFEYIILFKKQGTAKKPSEEQKFAAKMTTEEWNTYFTGHWHIPGCKQDKHLAMFPDELPRRLIKMFSFPGETVLDPFAGSGTTAKTARELGRNSISYEINQEYLPIIENKIGFSDLISDVEIITDSTQGTTEQIAEKIDKLPYVFIDTHKLDKKIDVKKLQYGSKIDSKTSRRQEMFRVKKIISPELLLLNNDCLVKLIGIKTDADKTDDACTFLSEKFKKHRVYIKFDTQKHDEENHLLVYLYLDNKTFINAHLLKEKLVYMDESDSFALRDKFYNLRYGGEIWQKNGY